MNRGFCCRPNTLFSTTVHSTSSSWIMMSFFNTLIAYTSSVFLCSAKLTRGHQMESVLKASVLIVYSGPTSTTAERSPTSGRLIVQEPKETSALPRDYQTVSFYVFQMVIMRSILFPPVRDQRK
ncbi:hypothetical protein EGR_03540 [Echinococcus granulosus]|uniref:Uncharacterized protein n=1 Tax=Echinococcus granulosus TaxID=6210 RepID=W6UK16_ECHGR|nr:hypothetical protein EGR_03540 [Echinococcus granulosus]EUB61476.1 hypothetical protein EGR_03540 [Echinococcus granulosus]